MQPIIPIWLIYLSGVVDDIKSFIDIFGTLGIVFSVVALICVIVFFDLDDTYKYVKKCLKYLLISLIFTFASTLIPSQKTVYTMMIGSQITPNNIELVGGTVKSTMDYMFDKTESLVKSVKGDK